MKSPLITLLVSLGLGLLVLSQSVFFVPESKRAIILQLGDPLDAICEPGLNFRIPFIQSVKYVDNRILMFVIDKASSFSSDSKSIEMDNYVCWRIADPLTFIRKLGNEISATARLHEIVFSQLRAAIGGKTLGDVVGPSRNEIMQQVLIESNKRAVEYGITFVDVRIKRADLPNRQAIFDRMNAERTRMANEYRYSGESMAREIRSQAELDRDTIQAEAERESIIIRGKAEAEAMRTFAEAISKAPEFYEFSRSLEVYKNAFQQNTKIIFSSDDTLLKHFQQ